jgi:hypothetical protein
LFEVGMARSKSMRTTMMALQYLVEWGRCSDAVGYPVAVEEYADRMEVSRAQAFRRQKAFRECFPKDDIETLWEIVRRHLGGRWKAAPFVSQAVLVASLASTRSKPPGARE